MSIGRHRGTHITDGSENVQTVKLANVDIDDSEQYLSCPNLWVRCADGGRLPTKRRGGEYGVHGFIMDGNGTYDFMTYYGALSLRKWVRYTEAQDFELHVTARGRYAIVMEYADAWAYPSTIEEGKRFEFDDADFAKHVIPIGCKMRQNTHGTVPVLVGFRIETVSDCDVRSLGWFAHVDKVRDVTLAICTTTFRKEKYIRANIAKIKRDILYGGEQDYAAAEDDDGFDEVSRHLIMNVVDNGRTLPVTELEGNSVRVFPNPNAGGAGGFARGMIESMDEHATHALMMDDDVRFCTEAFIRTFNLLCIVREEYANAFVSGGMLSMYDGDLQTEDTGFMSYDGYCHAVKPVMRLSLMHEAVHNETFEPILYRPDCQDIRQRYAAWWYCCIPMTQIKRRGLPLPLFVRFDDVEFALREHNEANNRFMTMNGICVWHEPFFLRYDAAVEKYQTARNALIIRAASDAAPESDFMHMIEQSFSLEIKRLNYDDAAIVCEGVEDYLKGPGVCFAPGFAERRFLETHKSREKTMSFVEASDTLLDLGLDIDGLEPFDVTKDYKRSIAERGKDLVTYLGHDLTKIVGSGQASGDTAESKDDDDAWYYSQADKIAIMVRDSGAYQPGEIRNADVIVAIDLPNQRVSIRRRDNDRFGELYKRFRHDMHQVRARDTELRQAYKDAAAQMHTRGAWARYLGLEDTDEQQHGTSE